MAVTIITGKIHACNYALESRMSRFKESLPKLTIKNMEERCPVCGRPVDRDYKLCPYCGEPLIKQKG